MEHLARHERSLSRAPRAAAEGHVLYLEAWMEDHLADPLSIDDLVAVVNLVPRSIQYAFRRRRGCTPMQALHERRLVRARQDLLEAGSSLTVTEVATLCGLYHLGRFARRYRERFGEAPSTTPARARTKSLAVPSGM